MFCSRCGSPIPVDPEAKFCARCGAALPERTEPRPPADSEIVLDPPSSVDEPVSPLTDTVTINAPAEVASVPYGGFLVRLVAYLVDGAIQSVALGIIGGILAGIIAATYGLAASTRSTDSLATASVFGAIVVFGVISLALTVAYYVVLPPMFGATPGKLIFGYEIVDSEFRRISYGAAVLRLLGYIVSGAVLYLGFIWIGVDDKKQAWHDKIAGTFVVKKEAVVR
jgi:uncharacterized RDD family membrane protein YckC